MYYLKEESSCCMRWCCGQARALSVSFQDNQGNEILRFERPLRFLGCCSDCCYPSLTQVNSTIFSISNPLHKVKLPNYLNFQFSVLSFWKYFIRIDFLDESEKYQFAVQEKSLKYLIKMMKKSMIFLDLVVRSVAEVLWIFK